MVDNSVADILIKVSGKPLKAEVARDLVDVKISEALDMSASFTLRMSTWDLDKQQVSWADSAPFGLGVDVEIQMGYVGDLRPMIAGEVTSLNVSFSAGSTPVLTVGGIDYRRRLTQERIIASYSNQKDSDIAAAVIERNKLTPQVTATDVVRESELQDNKTDLEFLQHLAARNDFEIAIDGKTVVFGPPRPAGQPLRLSTNTNLFEFEAGVSAAEFWSEIVIQDRDAETREPFVVRHSTKSYPGQIASVDKLSGRPRVLTDVIVASEAEARALAKAKMDESLAGMLSASGRCPGDPALRAGVLVDVEGVGKRFGGRYRVQSASHTFAPSRGYSTTFQLNWSET